MKIIGIDRKERQPHVHHKETLRSLAKRMKEQMTEARQVVVANGMIDLNAERAARRNTRRRASNITPPSGFDAYESYEPMFRRGMI